MVDYFRQWSWLPQLYPSFRSRQMGDTVKPVSTLYWAPIWLAGTRELILPLAQLGPMSPNHGERDHNKWQHLQWALPTHPSRVTYPAL